MNIKPLGDHVVVKLLEVEQVTASGILLPDTADKKEKAQGEVVAVGPGKLLDNGTRGSVDVSVGDVVLFKKWGGDDVEVDRQEYKIISGEDILAILE
jgi:chaperonin GroES